MWVEVDGVRTHYETAGTSGPVVVLIHGVGEHSGLSWKYLLGQLGERYRVYALDMPGHGQSDKPDAPCSVAYYVPFLGRLLDALHLEKVTLMGLSMGASRWGTH